VDQRIRAAERLLAKVAPDLKAVEMTIESEVEATINHDAHDKVLKLIDGEVKCGIFEGLKRFGLSDEQAHLAMVRSTNQQVTADS